MKPPLKLDSFKKRLNALLAARRHVTLVVEGRCAAGKSSFAAYLAQQYQARVTHMDDFFLPPILRTTERLGTAGGNVHYERFGEEVAYRLGGDISYRRFNCKTGVLEPPELLQFAQLDIVEGAYSLHPYFGDYSDLRVFLNVDKADQLQRLAARNGQEELERFRLEWIPLEEAYFQACDVERRCDFSYNTSLYEVPWS